MNKNDIDKLLADITSPYNPYSGFDVRAIVVTTDGKTYGGVNVENANYTLTKHAEEVAITQAIMDGAIERCGREFIKDIIVACASDAAPCGGCRQFINEFVAPDASWVGINTETDAVTSDMFTNIFPRAFGPADLGL